MKKTVFLAFVSLLLLLSMLMLGTRLVIPVGGSTTHHVYPGQSIQEAMNSAQSGDTIFVHNGTYYEHVILNKTVMLIGEGSATTIIDGNGTWNPILEVTVMDVEITGFTIQHGGYGIYLKENSFCNIHGNIVRNNTYGIALLYSDDNTIAENIVPNNRDGIALLESDNNMIASNNVLNNYGGISLSSSGENTLRSNNMTGNRINFGVVGQKLSHFIQDIDDSNTVNGKPIYYWVNQRNKQVPADAGCVALVESYNVTVKNLNLNCNFMGVLLAYTTYSTIENVTASGNRVGEGLVCSHNNTMINNTLVDNNEGVELASSYDNAITGNNVSNNSLYGILLDGSRNNTIEDNTITNNGCGVSLRSADDSTISGNTITSNSDDGIYMYRCLRNIVGRNELTNNTVGIHLYETHSYSGDQHANNIITGNLVLNNSEGIRLESMSIGNEIVGNTVSDNDYGIKLIDSRHNIIYHNNFINNTQQVYSDGSNAWNDDYPSGGNYWSDYTGVDLYSGPFQNVLGSDGVGDTPYTKWGIVDHYPFINPWSPPNVILTIPEVIFNPNDRTHFNFTLQNHEDSITYVDVTRIIVTMDNGAFLEMNETIPTLPYRLYPNSNVTFRCAWDWSDYRGIKVAVTVYTQQGYLAGKTTRLFRHIHVYPGQSIQEAINVAQTGDTIFVHAGTYYEHVTIHKSLKLQGENKDNTIIDGNGSGTVVSIDIIDNVTISNFTIQNGATGVKTSYSTNVVLRNNNVTKMPSEGVWLDYSSNNKVCDNTISNVGGDGIYVSAMLPKSYNNYISGNVISDCSGDALYLINADSNDIIGNTLYGQIRLDGSYNTLYHNNIDGRVTMHSMMRGNRFDNGFEGNYWSDYDGVDEDHDGIGDNPHVINENIQDNYPLMEPFSDFSVDYEEETYHVTTICNSTISAFQFDNVNKIISFNVTGPDDSLGFCRVAIPNVIVQGLWQGDYTVLVDGEEPLKMNNWTDWTYTYIYFTYLHSEHEVEIIPEFPTWTSMLLILIVLTIAIAIYKRRLLKH